MKIERVNFHQDIRVPKPLPGYGGASTGLASDGRVTITWQEGWTCLRITHVDAPGTVFRIPLLQVDSMVAADEEVPSVVPGIEAARRAPR